QRVGEDEQALSAAAQLVQSSGQLRIALDVARDVLAQLALQRPVAVHFVDALAHVVVELVVVDALAAAFQRLDDLGVEAGFGQAIFATIRSSVMWKASSSICRMEYTASV